MARPILIAEMRDISGKKVKNIRKAGFIPAVLYGRKVKPSNIKFEKKQFEKLFLDAGTNTICELKLDTEDRNVLIHEPDVHPVTGDFQHVDIYQVDMSEKINAEVPINFINEAPAVRGMDGTLVTNKDAIRVECLPNDLPHEFAVDLAPLVDFEARILVSDIKAPLGVEILEEPEEMVVYVEPPRSEEEMAALEEAPVEGELPEVIGEEKAEGAGEPGEEGEKAAPAEESPKTE